MFLITAVKRTAEEVFHAFPTVNNILRIMEHTEEGIRETGVFCVLFIYVREVHTDRMSFTRNMAAPISVLSHAHSYG